MLSWVVIAAAVFLSVPAFARAQSVEAHASAGPTLVDRGHSVAVGSGWSPWSRLTVTVDVERTVLATRVTRDGRGGESAFRGGSVVLGAAGVRLALFPPGRVTPYLVAGVAAGRSRPTVNGRFPVAVTNDARAIVGGGGLEAPLGRRVVVFADARVQVGGDGGETLALAPLRVGLRWRF